MNKRKSNQKDFNNIFGDSLAFIIIKFEKNVNLKL